MHVSKSSIIIIIIIDTLMCQEHFNYIFAELNFVYFIELLLKWFTLNSTPKLSIMMYVLYNIDSQIEIHINNL